jgi:hypothetical protein
MLPHLVLAKEGQFCLQRQLNIPHEVDTVLRADLTLLLQ